MNEIDDFDLIDEIEPEKDPNSFKLNQIKVEYFHWNDNEIEKGNPISTSIEFKKEETNKWIKIVKHSYYHLTNGIEVKENEYKEEIDKAIISKLETIDLRNLKNNYYTDTEPENNSHWEITYNYRFKIVGTEDQLLNEIKNIFDIVSLEDIIDEEKLKVIDLFS